MAKLSITDIDIKGKKVLMRCDYNVPLDKNRNITDDTRVKASLKTIKYVLDNNCPLILCSHLGRPKGSVKPELGLKPVADRLRELLPEASKVIMAPDCVGEEVKKLAEELKPGEILLLENLRFHKEETDNDAGFAGKLASLAEVFVQEAFGTVHRAHASTAGVAGQLPAVAGFLLQKEIKYLGNAVKNPQKPFVAILGGAKVSGKIAVLKNLIDKVDTMIIGGAMTYTFLKSKGITIGNSLLEEDSIGVAREVMDKAFKNNVKLLLPDDHIIADKVDAGAEAKEVSDANIPDGLIGVDIGPKTIRKYVAEIKSAKTIVWNGPMGVFEIDKFAKGTFEVAKAVAEATGNGVVSVIGGGDSVAAVNKMGLNDRMTHISTGGGASLEFLEGKDLPGITALKDK